MRNAYQWFLWCIVYSILPAFMRWPCREHPEPQLSAVSSFAFLLHLNFSLSFPLFHDIAFSPDDYIIPEKASCLGCPEEIDENSEDLRVPLSVSIAKYNSISESAHLFTLHSVGLATRQVETGWYEGRGSGEGSFFYPPCVCIPAGGRRLQVQAKIWYEENHLHQGWSQGPQQTVCPRFTECGKYGNETHITTDDTWYFPSLYNTVVLFVFVCAGV